jgi:N6-L-threonylcarbamoyladenine synthase
MTRQSGLDFSFSGLKTSVLTTWRDQVDKNEQTRADIARAFQDAVIDTLIIKCRRALKQTGLKNLVIAGGVGANQGLRTSLLALAEQMGINVYYPRPMFCTDNGAMIAYAGSLRLAAGESEPLAFSAQPRWSMETI